MNVSAQALVDQLMAVEPSWFPTAGIPSPDTRQEGLLLVDTVVSGSKLLWFAYWLHSHSLSPQLHFAMQLSCKMPRAVIGLVLSWWCLLPRQALPHLHLHTSHCLQSLPCSDSASSHQKATDSSISAPVVAHWGWPVRVRKSGKAWWGQDRLSNLCGCEDDTGWRGSGRLRKWLVPCVSGGEEVGVRYHRILSDTVVKFMHLAED